MSVLQKVRRKAKHLLDEPGNIYSAVSVLYIFSHIFSLVSYGYTVSNGNKKYSVSLPFVFKTILHGIVFFSAYTVLCVSYRCEISNVMGHNKYHILQDIAIGLLALTEILVGCLFSKKMVEFFENVKEIDEGFLDLSIKMKYR